MSSATFPTFAGINIAWKRAAVYSEKVQAAASGKEIVVQRWAAAKFEFVGRINVLRDSASEPGTLMAFVDQHKGRADTFNFTDPLDGTSRRARFDMDKYELERIVSGAWKAATLRLVTVF